MERLALVQSVFFDWLWRVSWEASALVPIVLCTQWLFGRALSPSWRHSFWLLVLLRLALPLVPASGLSIFNLPWRAWGAPAALRILTLSRPSFLASHAQGKTMPEDVHMDTLWTGSDNELSPSGLAPLPSQPDGMNPNEWNLTPGFLDRATQSADGAKPPTAAFLRWRSALSLLLVAAPWIWLSGALFFGLRLLCENLMFSARVRLERVINDARVNALLRSCSRQMRVRRPPLLVETGQLQSPALYGLSRPRLLLPAGLIDAFSTGELRCVFLHELGHVKRHDMALNWLMTVFQVLHWFNPILSFAFSRMRADRELACDAMALSHAEDGERRCYGETIIKILSRVQRPAARPAVVGILEDRRQMRNRMRRIAQFQRTSRWPVSSVCLFAGLAVMTLTDAQPDKSQNHAPRAPVPIVDATAIGPTISTEVTRPSPAGPSAEPTTNLARLSPGKQMTQSKLQSIILDRVEYDGLPLSEVVRDLVTQSRKADPAQQGINIIIDSTAPRKAPTNSLTEPSTPLNDVTIQTLPVVHNGPRDKVKSKEITLDAHWIEVKGPGPIPFDWLFGKSGATIEPEPAAQPPKGDQPGAKSPYATNIRVIEKKTADEIVRLSGVQAKALLEYVAHRPGTDLLSPSTVRTVSGHEARLEVLEVKSVVAGVEISPDDRGKDRATYQPETVSVGPRLQVNPVWKDPEWEIHLVGQLTEFLGYRDAGVTNSPHGSFQAKRPMPEFRVREVVATGMVKPGESLFLRMPATEETLKDGKKRRADRAQDGKLAKGLYLLVNVVDDGP